MVFKKICYCFEEGKGHDIYGKMYRINLNHKDCLK